MKIVPQLPKRERDRFIGGVMYAAMAHGISTEPDPPAASAAMARAL